MGVNPRKEEIKERAKEIDRAIKNHRWEDLVEEDDDYDDYDDEEYDRR